MCFVNERFTFISGQMYSITHWVQRYNFILISKINLSLEGLFLIGPNF